MPGFVGRDYTQGGMLERAMTRALPLANRAADYAPVAPACCNACRVCATNGVIGLMFAAGGALAAFTARFASRFAHPS
jgi:hypothetical protein